MRAAQFYGQEDIKIDDVSEPRPAADEVKLRNAYSGICGSDLAIYFTPEHAGMDWSKPHPLTGAELPQILGHEFSAEVVEVGENVRDVHAGDLVAVRPTYSCGECSACAKRAFNTCTSISWHGVYSHGGGLAEFTTVKANMVHKLPRGVDLKLGALVEPMAVAWHAVKKSRVRPGSTALIAGAGPIGIGVWFALRAAGIETIIVSEPSATRRAAIVALGAEHVIDPVTEDLAETVRTVTGWPGVEFAFDASGVAPAFAQALQSLDVHGTLTVIALHKQAFEFNPMSLVLGEKRIAGVTGYTQDDFDEVLAAMAKGSYDPAGWVEIAELAELPAALHRLRDGQAMKILIEVQG